MKIILGIVFAALIVTGTNAAQLYRWIDDKGNVEWRDTPPPTAGKKLEQRNIGSNVIETTSTPYSVQQAVKNFPVILWVYACGTPCDQARAHLGRRGTPHTVKNPQDDMEQYQNLTGGTMNVPMLIVGSTRLQGYLAKEWDNALDAAGYPLSVPGGPKPAPKAPASDIPPAPVAKTQPTTPPAAAAAP
jgi:hypothetical protein